MSGFAEAFERLRTELTSYLTRLVVRVAVAEELVQETALRALTAERPPADGEWRPWLFRVATNLALDHRRKHGTWRETVLLDARKAAAGDARFADVRTLRGSPEMAAVAREHIAVCFGCVLGGLPPEQAAALLLREVYGFTNGEAAGMLEAREGQVKNWLQAARAAMTERYEASCALINKQGVCYQCVELDDYYRAGAGDPLAGTPGARQDRLELLRRDGDRPPGRWTRLLSELLGEIG
ncbi:MAG: RNA polymerase sigma factor [Gemmataceae bacterium]